MMFSYTRALVRDIPDSFVNALCAESPSTPVNLIRARRQHEAYVAAIRRALPASTDSILTLPADERFPDCTFIEDTAVVVGSTAILAQSAMPSRAGEAAAVEAALASLNIRVERMQGEGRLDGGDVLVLRDVILVGLSHRTNAAGAAALEAALGGARRVVPVRVPEALHLKSLLSALDGDAVLVHDRAVGGASLAAHVEEAVRAAGGDAARLEFVPVPEMLAANALRVGNTLIGQGGDRARAVLRAAAEVRGLELDWVDMSETAKMDGALTCCSILLS